MVILKKRPYCYHCVCVLKFIIIMFILFIIAQRNLKPPTEKTKLTENDYAMVTRAWFHPEDPTIPDIKTECKNKEMSTGFGVSSLWKKNSLRNWMIHFGKQAVQHALVSLKRHHSLQISDVECHK